MEGYITVWCVDKQNLFLSSGAASILGDGGVLQNINATPNKPVKLRLDTRAHARTNSPSAPRPCGNVRVGEHFMRPAASNPQHKKTPEWSNVALNK